MNTLVKSLVVATSLLVSTPAWAGGKKDPIDAKMEKAMDENPSTAGMVAAATAASHSWEKEMEQLLAKLLKKLLPNERAALEVSQRQWAEFRKAELDTQGKIFANMEGTMWRPVAALKALQLTKDRVLILRGYAETVSER